MSFSDESFTRGVEQSCSWIAPTAGSADHLNSAQDRRARAVEPRSFIYLRSRDGMSAAQSAKLCDIVTEIAAGERRVKIILQVRHTLSNYTAPGIHHVIPCLP